jgi:rubredoxin
LIITARFPIQWPWNRNGQSGYPSNQPWVFVPRDEEANPPPINPYYSPPPFGPVPPPQETPAPPPEPMQSLATDRECPMCKILFPPGQSIKYIEDHVNEHFSETNQ